MQKLGGDEKNKRTKRQTGKIIAIIEYRSCTGSDHQSLHLSDSQDNQTAFTSPNQTSLGPFLPTQELVGEKSARLSWSLHETKHRQSIEYNNIQHPLPVHPTQTFSLSSLNTNHRLLAWIHGAGTRTEPVAFRVSRLERQSCVSSSSRCQVLQTDDVPCCYFSFFLWEIFPLSF